MDIAAASNETIFQRAKHVHPLNGATNLTAYGVELALVLDGTPAATDWFAASWESTADADGFYFAKAEIGPGGAVTLTANNLYRIWLRLTLPTETPVIAGEFVFAY